MVVENTENLRTPPEVEANGFWFVFDETPGGTIDSLPFVDYFAVGEVPLASPFTCRSMYEHDKLHKPQYERLF